MNSRSKLMTGSPTHFFSHVEGQWKPQNIKHTKNRSATESFSKCLLPITRLETAVSADLRNCYLSLQSNDILTICQNMSNLFLK